jgi:hypothetical protein
VNEETLVWKDNAILTKQKRGPYLVGLIKKSTYYDKWGLNGAFTIAASNTKNIFLLQEILTIIFLLQI